MEKVKVSLTINDYSLNTTGIINNGILSFKDKDQLKTEIIYDYNTNTLIRDNKEITIKLFFNKKDNTIEYLLKSNNCKIYNNFSNFSLLKDDNIYIINYRIEDAEFNMKLSYRKE